MQDARGNTGRPEEALHVQKQWEGYTMGRSEVGLDQSAGADRYPGYGDRQNVTPEEWGKLRRCPASSIRRRRSLESAATSSWGWNQRIPPRDGAGTTYDDRAPAGCSHQTLHVREMQYFVSPPWRSIGGAARSAHQ
eukprot:GHVU01095511.1.p1 GENE.GHVU01095511.1~~GHVU01095511.1.p1  ORF type:complete len:136 (+),score=4.32 GHVU01095511.1:127-534(+)